MVFAVCIRIGEYERMLEHGINKKPEYNKHTTACSIYSLTDEMVFKFSCLVFFFGFTMEINQSSTCNNSLVSFCGRQINGNAMTVIKLGQVLK